MEARTPMDDLSAEHTALASDAAALRALAQRLSVEDEGAVDAVTGHLRLRVAAFHHDFGVHCLREEQCLYPQARRAAAEGRLPDPSLVRFLDSEADEDLGAHHTIAQRLDDVKTALSAVETAGRLNAEDIVGVRALLAAALGVLTRHVRKEEELVYPVLLRALTPAQLLAVQQGLWAVPVDRAGPPVGAEPEPENPIPGW